MSILQFYSEVNEVTDLSKYQEFTKALTTDIRAIFQVVQGLLVHGSWTRFYNINEEQYPYKNFYNFYIQGLLDKALMLENNIDLLIPRSPQKRVICSCREFATLFCALLRSKGIPARSRCGFANYLAKDGYYEDHWICEYWQNNQWIKVDPQIDPFIQSKLQYWILNDKSSSIKLRHIIKNFNPLSLGADDFITSAEAWIKCRSEEYDCNKFGINDDASQYGLTSLYGLWFIRGNLIRDFASLNKYETMPLLNRLCNNLDWQFWRLISCNDDELTNSDWILLDKIAELSLNVDDNLSEIQSVYANNEELRVPELFLKGM